MPEPAIFQNWLLPDGLCWDTQLFYGDDTTQTQSRPTNQPPTSNDYQESCLAAGKPPTKILLPIRHPSHLRSKSLTWLLPWEQLPWMAVFWDPSIDNESPQSQTHSHPHEQRRQPTEPQTRLENILTQINHFNHLNTTLPSRRRRTTTTMNRRDLSRMGIGFCCSDFFLWRCATLLAVGWSPSLSRKPVRWQTAADTQWQVRLGHRENPNLLQFVVPLSTRPDDDDNALEVMGVLFDYQTIMLWFWNPFTEGDLSCWKMVKEWTIRLRQWMFPKSLQEFI